jgi:hypothetical protein
MNDHTARHERWRRWKWLAMTQPAVEKREAKFWGEPGPGVSGGVGTSRAR